MSFGLLPEYCTKWSTAVQLGINHSFGLLRQNLLLTFGDCFRTYGIYQFYRRYFFELTEKTLHDRNLNICTIAIAITALERKPRIRSFMSLVITRELILLNFRFFTTVLYFSLRKEFSDFFVKHFPVCVIPCLQ